MLWGVFVHCPMLNSAPAISTPIATLMPHVKEELLSTILIFIFSVETCKPILLRKKIFQCTNLLDIVKLLVNHVDLNKLQSQETERVRYVYVLYFSNILYEPVLNCINLFANHIYFMFQHR